MRAILGVALAVAFAVPHAPASAETCLYLPKPGAPTKIVCVPQISCLYLPKPPTQIICLPSGN